MVIHRTQREKLRKILYKKMYYVIFIIIMLQFFGGIVVGVCIGTYYDCKPFIEKSAQFIKEHMPKERK